MKILKDLNKSINEEREISKLEILDFIDEEDFQDWITDPNNEEYLDILGYKILDDIFSEENKYKLNLFVASIDTINSVIYIHRNQYKESISLLMNFYSELEEYEICDIFKEAIQILNNKRG